MQFDDQGLLIYTPSEVSMKHPNASSLLIYWKKHGEHAIVESGELV